jgi:Zn-dependent protease with chaperone function
VSVHGNFTESARTAIARAEKEARTLGCSFVDSEHLLLGICHEDAGKFLAFAAAGLTAPNIRAWLTAADRRGSGMPAEATTFTERARSVFSQAEWHAASRQHASVGVAHMLLALVHPTTKTALLATENAQPNVGALLRDLNIEPGAVYRKAAAIANTENSGQGFPYLGEDFSAVAGLASRWQCWSRNASVLIVYAAFAATAILLTPAERPINMGLALLGPATALVLGNAVVIRYLCRMRLAKPDAERISVPGLRAALASARLRDVTVICVPGGRLTGRGTGQARRHGRAGMIFLRPAMKRGDPDLARFVTAHEAAHLARDDISTLNVAVACLIGLFLVAASSAQAGCLLVPACLGFIALQWRSEIACDRLALRAAGRIPADLFLAQLAAGDERRRKHPLPRRLVKQLAVLLSHPPTSVRRNALRQTTGSSELPGESTNLCG